MNKKVENFFLRCYGLFKGSCIWKKEEVNRSSIKNREVKFRILDILLGWGGIVEYKGKIVFICMVCG